MADKIIIVGQNLSDNGENKVEIHINETDGLWYAVGLTQTQVLVPTYFTATASWPVSSYVHIMNDYSDGPSVDKWLTVKSGTYSYLIPAFSMYG